MNNIGTPENDILIPLMTDHFEFSFGNAPRFLAVESTMR